MAVMLGSIILTLAFKPPPSSYHLTWDTLAGHSGLGAAELVAVTITNDGADVFVPSVRLGDKVGATNPGSCTYPLLPSSLVAFPCGSFKLMVKRIRPFPMVPSKLFAHFKWHRWILARHQ